MASTLQQRRPTNILSHLEEIRRTGYLATYIVVTLGVVLLVLVANLFAGRVFADSWRVELGTRPDRSIVNDMHGPERDSLNTTYRWSRGESQITLFGPATNAPAIVKLDLGWLPPNSAAPRSVYLRLDEGIWTRIDVPDQPRLYSILQPEGVMADGMATIQLRTDTTIVPPDDRPLGIRIDAVGLSWPATPWPLPPLLVLGAQAGLALSWLYMARRLGLAARSAIPIAILLIGILAVVTVAERFLAEPYILRLFGGAIAGCAVTLIAAVALRYALPDAPDWFVRTLLLITLAALAIRLVGVLYPSFLSHDLWVNGRRLNFVQTGTLTLFDRPSEFSRRVVNVSPSAFILAAPLGLIGDRGIALHGLYSILDGTTALLVAILARRVGLGWRASLVAAALIAALPMYMTALYWGFVKQIVGQWLTLLLFVIVAGPAPRTRIAWFAVGALCTVNLLIHPGGLLLSGVCLGLYVLIGGGRQLHDTIRSNAMDLPTALGSPALELWRNWLFCFGGAALAALVLQYADAAVLVIGGMISGATESPLGTNQQSDQAARLWQIWVGLRASFEPLTLLLVVLSLPALFRRAQGHVHLLAACWFAAAVVFFVIDIVTGQQVRYGYFVAPLVCVGVAALTERLLDKPLGRAAVVALIVLVVFAGGQLWLNAALEGVRPSVNPLTH